MITIKKGLDIPISGAPEQVIHEAPAVHHVALLGEEFPGLKPTMLVKVGDLVKKGQPLFENKKNPGVIFTAPAAGRVTEIHRGHQRVFQALVIAQNPEIGSVSFPHYPQDQLAQLSREQVQQQLLDSGLWTALRTRPYSKSPVPGSEPKAIFVTAMDTNPLAASAELIIEQQAAAFLNGLTVLSRLTDGKVYVCKGENSLPRSHIANIEEKVFSGPHPAGLPGTHIHFIEPASAKKTLWHINYQDVIAIGHLFVSGELYNERIISLAGPGVSKPRLLRTQQGACISELTRNELQAGEQRLISGSVLGGHKAAEVHDYLGRFHLQVSVVPEGREKAFLGWIMPGREKFSVTRSFLGHLSNIRNLVFTTAKNGSDRAMVPIGNYEKIMPLDILPTLLLRDLAAGDTDSAQQLGCLELDEEDLALCTFVCPGKTEYGPLLRKCLTKIELEG
ncbi:MAG: Na(+)-translocating NADH-quinone reductase subunit A [Gammaproteobacteria bacterium]|uniref:Na(+)-translocating NADH-quinone reductase subunit A n=1 Tax=Tolumonas osonensis TaxID=675874 RepID=A0A841GM98_9GAMM|nr:Na(+)-translocating NADH-quinone reductase subunit A [Tolumonas osonensis]MBB6056435.1 Na+-transporting NADH:ubiquinone oxidoreductase subunit A [Tolumonas osonensis]NCB60197.1 Na(+)-translocating NADH-quinone reductase subunit A [Gammaproteobacteria bacterium]